MNIRFVIKILIALSLSSSVLAADCNSYFSKSGISTFPYMSVSRTHTLAKKMAEIYKNRNAKMHFEMDQNLASVHSQREMTFQVKNPITGMYDKFVDVPVNSRAVVMNTKKFNGLIKSTGPILRRLRSLLQSIYSGSGITAENLGLEHLPVKEQSLVLDIIKESIYLEPLLMHENMSEYPFLAVAGFDGAIGDPDNPDPQFFEMNLGTPSGLSNNILILEALLKQDKDFRDTIGPYLPNLAKDDTFAILRETIQDNALAWTEEPDGISVVVSPGVYNGAHADVAAISKLTGMPLIKASDLYVDSDGNVRLVSSDGSNPIVTGIYGRMEESFFLQTEGLPMISPNNIATNKRLSLELGLELRPAASYKYIKDKDGKAIDIQRDSKGKPIYLRVWDRAGENPSGEKSPYGLLEAIKNRKLYYSAIGGRVVDDKRLFPIVSKYLVPTEEQDGLARPVSTLSRDEFDKLYKDPKSYVVKEPNNSGGVGVYFLLEMSENDIENLLSRVRLSPNEFEVQEVRSPNTLLSYFKNKRGDIESTEVATDIRIFPMMDSQGNVRAGPNSLLFRTGPQDSFYSNTSMGGGYGVVAVTRGVPKPDLPAKIYYGYDVPSPGKNILALKQAENFGVFLDSLWDMKQTLGSNTDMDLLRQELRALSFKFRALMDLIPESARYLPALLRYYADKPGLNTSDLTEMENRLIGYLWDLYIVQDDLDKDIRVRSNNFFAKHEERLKQNQNYGHPRSIESQLPEGVELKYLKNPERINVMSNSDGSVSEKFEVAEILQVPNKEMQKLIDELKAAGGELRLPQKVRTDALGKKVFQESIGGFWVNYTLPELTSFLRPVISFDVTAQPGSMKEARKLAVLSHEMEHFRYWKETYDKMLSEGLPKAEALKSAYLYVDSLDNIVANERRALNKEIEVEKQMAERLGVSHLGYPIEDTQFGYANRMLYPEFEGMRRHLLNYTDENYSKAEQAESLAKAKELIRKQVLSVTVMRKNALAKLSQTDGFFKRAMRVLAPNSASKFWTKDDYILWQQTSHVDLIAFPYGIEWLLGQHTISLFVKLYKEVTTELGLEDDLASSSTFKALAKSGADMSSFKNEQQQGQQQ